jgi:hypothetical protein
MSLETQCKFAIRTVVNCDNSDASSLCWSSYRPIRVQRGNAQFATRESRWPHGACHHGQQTPPHARGGFIPLGSVHRLRHTVALK